VKAIDVWMGTCTGEVLKLKDRNVINFFKYLNNTFLKVIRRLLTAEDWVKFVGSPCGIYV